MMFSPPITFPVLLSREADIPFSLGFATIPLDPGEQLQSVETATIEVTTDVPWAADWTDVTTTLLQSAAQINGQVESATTQDAGTGYVAGTILQATVDAAPAGGTTAQVSAVVQSDGTVGPAIIEQAGAGYTQAPLATFPAPSMGTQATVVLTVVLSTVTFIVGAKNAVPGSYYRLRTSAQTNYGRSRQADDMIVICRVSNV